jgi:hypothetical protein
VTTAAPGWTDTLRRLFSPRGGLPMAIALVGAGLLFAPGRTAAQTPPSITLPATIAAEPAAQTPLGIRVGPTEAIPRNSFLRLRGLPTMAALSEGHSIAPGAWAVPLAALPNLKITLPAGAAGRSEFVATLVNSDGAVLAAAKSMLVINTGGAGARDDTARASGGPPASATILRAGAPLQTPQATERNTGPAPKASAQRMTPEDRDRATRLMKKGDEALFEGNISAARLLYERAADVGLAEAAMALAGTFDAPELSRLQVRGIAPNATEARRWYERARELGAIGAAEQLQRLGAK